MERFRIMLQKIFLLAGCLIVLSLSYLFFLAKDSSVQAQLPIPAQVTDLSPRRVAFYKRAATEFWGARVDLSTVPCHPRHVVVKVEDINGYDSWNPDDPSTWDISSHDSDARAAAFIEGAYPLKGGQFEGRTDYEGYCTVYWDKRTFETGQEACIVFIHEYGHLLGRYHSNDIGSPMYTSFLNPGGGDLFLRWKKKQLGKTICGRLSDIR